MAALARWCYQHRFVVITAWIGLLVGLAVMSQALKTTYDNSLTLPGTGSGSAQALLQRSAPGPGGRHRPDRLAGEPWQRHRSRHRAADVRNARARVPGAGGGLGCQPLPAGRPAQVSQDRRTAYAIVNFTKASDNLDTADIGQVIAVAEAARQRGLAVELGGQAVSHAEQAPVSAISAIGIVAAAVILLVAFGSLFAMVLPIATAVAGVGTGMLLMAPLSHLMSLTGIAPVLGALIGLGVGVDYALFIVTRYRRGLLAGLDPQGSAVQALNTSGRAVLFAGGTVCVALLGLLTIGQQFIDGLAFAGTITVVCTVLAAVTLLPALFGLLGPRVLSRKQRRGLLADGPDQARGASGGWARWSRTVPRFPAALAAAGLAVMIVVSIPVLHLRLGFADASNDPASSTTYRAYEMLAEGFGPGFNGPLLLVAQTQFGG